MPIAPNGTLRRFLHGQWLREMPVTWALIAANTACLLVVIANSGRQVLFGTNSSEFLDRFILVPVLVAGGEWYRVPSAAFFHLGLKHYAGNMLCLWVLGQVLESFLGSWRYLLLYAVSILGSAAAIMWLTSPTHGVVGASGALFGLLGVAVISLWNQPSQRLSLLILIGLGLLGSVLPGVSMSAHLGGFVAGIVCGCLLRTVRRGGWDEKIRDLMIAGGCGIISYAIIWYRAEEIHQNIAVMHPW